MEATKASTPMGTQNENGASRPQERPGWAGSVRGNGAGLDDQKDS